MAATKPGRGPRQAVLFPPEPAQVLHLLRENLALLAELAVHYEVARLGEPQSVRTVTCPDDVARYLAPELEDLAQEQLRVVLLNTRAHIIATSLVYQGGINAVHVRIADVFRDAVRAGADRIVLVHNHPSGDPSPSPEDLAFTRDAVRAGSLLGIAVTDHVIIGKRRHVSLLRLGHVAPDPPSATVDAAPPSDAEKKRRRQL